MTAIRKVRLIGSRGLRPIKKQTNALRQHTKIEADNVPRV